MQQQQRRAATTSIGGVSSAKAATTTKRTRARNNSNIRQQMQQQQQNPIATATTITPKKQKTFTTFKFYNSMVDGVTESTTANVNFEHRSRKQKHFLELVDSDDINYEDDYTSSSSTFSSSSHQHSLDYEAEDEYEDKKKTYENKSLIHVQNFLKCFDCPTKKPAATKNDAAATTTAPLQTSSALTTVSYMNSALTAASAAEAELINSLTTFKSSLKASNYVSSGVTSNSCINTFLPFTSSNSSIPPCVGNISNDMTSVSYVSSSSALDNANTITSLNTKSNIIPVNSISVTELTDNQNSIASKMKSTSTSLELRSYRSHYKNIPSATTITATSTSTASTTAKLQKFQISTKFLRKPRTKLKMLPTVGQRHDELPTLLQLQQTEQEKQQDHLMAGLAPQLFTDDSNAKFKDFSIDSLLNK